MNDRDIQERLDAYEKIIQSAKKMSIRSFRVACSLYILELMLCALKVISFEMSVDLLELTAIIGLCLTICIDNQIHESILLYKNEVINLSLVGEDSYIEYFSKQKSMKENNCAIRKYYVWIHAFILILAFSLNFTITLDLNIDSPKIRNREVVINNTIILPNDSTIIVR